MKSTLTCREAARLLLGGEDHDITEDERAALQVHVRICVACERFVAQLNFMRCATQAWRKHSETDTDLDTDSDTDPGLPG